ncbi:DUF1330 domain-containing protein [Pseudomonas sp. NCHU5208]|uniref:DUF1330 domain-containing protein n=1 Tax=unclassified Pseudomonas TaxID=196821 RepID=UPI003F96A023
MLLHINKDQMSANDPAIFDARVNGTLFGQISASYLQLSKTMNNDEGIAVDTVHSDLPVTANDSRALLLVAFQFHDQPQRDALARYAADREPALSKHGGRVVFSAITERAEDWEFDGMEIIDFPSVETIQQLMADPDYRNRTAESSQVFGGAFAVARLEQN